MTRSIIGAVAVGTALALTACGGSSDKGSASGTSSAASAEPTTTSSTSAAPTSTADTTATSSAPTATSTATSTRSMTASPQSPIPGDSTTTGTATSSGTAGTVAPPGALDTAIRQHSFANSTFRTANVGTVTLHGGVATVNQAGGDPAHIGLQGTAQSIGQTRGAYYGDLNHDGIEDVVLQLNVIQGNGVSVEYSAWLGSKAGPARQLGTPFITMGRCGKDIKSITISPDGVITVRGGRGGTSCAEQGTGAPYVARYAVRGDRVVTLVAPPTDE